MKFYPSAIETKVDNWVSIEDEPGMLDCEIDELIERSGNWVSSAITDARASRGTAMIQSLMKYAVQNNFSENILQNKWKNEIWRRLAPRASTLNSFFGAKASRPPK